MAFSTLLLLLRTIRLMFTLKIATVMPIWTNIGDTDASVHNVHFSTNLHTSQSLFQAINLDINVVSYRKLSNSNWLSPKAE